MAYHCANTIFYSTLFYFIFLFRMNAFVLSFFSCVLSWYCQTTQLVYIIDEWLKEAIDDVEKENALKDIAVATPKDKGKVL